MRPFTFEKAQSAADAISKKGTGNQFIAGGTNLVDLMKKNIARPEVVITVTSALSKDISYEDNRLQIGAMASNTQVATHKRVLDKFPLISKAVLAGASPQIRNMASSAGNLLQRTRCPYFYDITTPCNKRNPQSGCSAAQDGTRMSAVAGYSDKCVAVHPSDFCIALAALDAEVVAVDAAHKEIKIPFKDFHKLPDTTPWLDNNLPANSIITGIEVPENNFAENYAYLKVRDRTSYAFALVSVAAALELNGKKIREARLASGGVAHKPWRWYDAEKFLRGKEATEEIFRQAAMLVVKDLKPLKENAFKIPMLEGAIVEALNQSLRP